MKEIKVASLFSGCGGLDLGFVKAGLDIIFHNEFDKEVLPTLRKNFKGKISDQDIRSLNAGDIPDVDIIIGGPPCQSFSIAGRNRGVSDRRGKLIYNFSKIINVVLPKAFLMENVKGLIGKKHKDILLDFIKGFENYKVYYKVVDAFDYGVPQNRERLFVVGIRKDLDKEFSFPQSKKYIKNTIDVIKNINNHEIYEGSFSSRYKSRNRVRKWGMPSFTIQASQRHIPLHPNCSMSKIEKDVFEFDIPPRRLSIQECARIQTFPDDFKFIYKNTAQAYKMIGNAVPVSLAQVFAESLKEVLYGC